MTKQKTAVYRAPKAIQQGAGQAVINKQIADANKGVTNQLNEIRSILRDLEDAKKETLKYFRGTITEERSSPNINGEMQFKSSNQTVDVKVRGNILDLNVKNIGNIRGFIRPVRSTDADAPNNSIYDSIDQNRLVYKDNSGVVNNLH